VTRFWNWGKPQQAIELDWRQKPADRMTDAELMAIAGGGKTGSEMTDEELMAIAAAK
jgi:hypothetical protein